MSRIETIADSQRFFPLVSSDKVRQVDFHGQYTAAAGTEPAHPLREYGVGAQILKDLGVRRMILMSNTRPNVLPGLDGYGLTVEGWRRIDGD